MCSVKSCCLLSLSALFAAAISMNVRQLEAAPQNDPSATPPAPSGVGALPAPAAKPDTSRLVPPAPPAGSTPIGTNPPTVQPLPAGKRTFRLPPPPANFSPPILHFAAPDYDWGSALQGELIRHDFVVENKGGAPLTITQVKASCGCTTFAKPEKPIEPGQTGTITLEIDTKKFSGTIRKTADISSNASPTPVKISMGGKVDPFFSIEPAAPKIDLVRGVEVEPIKVTLKRTSKVALQIKEVVTEQKILTAQLKEVTPGELYEILVTASIGENQSKYLSEQIKVKLNNEGKEFEIPVLVSVSVKERIDVQPRTSVYFSRNETKQITGSPGTEPVAKTLDIKSLGGPNHNFKVTNVAFEGATPNFETKLETVAEGKHYRLSVLFSKLPADTKTRTVRDVILISTDDPTVKEIKVTALAALQ